MSLRSTFFLVLFVAIKIKIYSKILAGYCARFGFIKFAFLIAFTRASSCSAGGRWLARLFAQDEWGNKDTSFVFLFHLLYLSPLRLVNSAPPARMTPLCRSATSPQFLFQKLGRNKRKFYAYGWRQ